MTDATITENTTDEGTRFRDKKTIEAGIFVHIDDSDGLRIVKFSPVKESDGITIENDTNIVLPENYDFNLLTFMPEDNLKHSFDKFKFLGLCLLDDTRNTKKERKWTSPIFGSNLYASGTLVSTISAFLPRRVGDKNNSFSIIYFDHAKEKVRVLDPTVRNQGND